MKTIVDTFASALSLQAITAGFSRLSQSIIDPFGFDDNSGCRMCCCCYEGCC